MTDRIEKLMKLLEAEPTDAFCLYGLAQEYARMSDHARAVEYYSRAIESDPDYLYAYFHMAKSLEAMSNMTAARQVLEKGLKRAADAGDPKALGEIAGYLDAIT
ncbi:MAG TPA: tetratricopeptide repeat protein [Phycisphaerales bacterium]|nr:tetratricopeptide repeat protein [Phycisphaerales bacterium]HRQ75284.1 tetratricopeptide repeat protein [Phycisphaerales bacterium]